MYKSCDKDMLGFFQSFTNRIKTVYILIHVPEFTCIKITVLDRNIDADYYEVKCMLVSKTIKHYFRMTNAKQHVTERLL